MNAIDPQARTGQPPDGHSPDGHSPTGHPPSVSDELAGFALGLRHEDVPAAVRERARHLILDAVGIAYASHSFPFAGVSLAAMRSLGEGSSPVIGAGRVLGARDAAVVNGILAHGLDYDDTHSRAIVHGTVSSFPCALAVADREGAHGRDLLTAYVAAMEVSTRVGVVARGGFHQVGFHPTGLVGAFGATLAAARLLGLGREQAVMAQGIVLSMAGGSLEFLEDGAWTKRLHPGWAAASAITAATLARHGFMGPRRAYEGRFGLFASHLGDRFDPADLPLATEGLGRDWQITEVAIKPFPACHFTHAAADAAIALGRDPRVSAATIRRVEVLVPEGVVKTVCEPVENKRAPANSYDAQFSISYVVATGLLRGRFTLDELGDAAIADPEVLALAARVDSAPDPDTTFPRHFTGEVIVHLRSGEVLRHREAVHRGSTDRPLANADIERKFFDNAARVLDPARAGRVRDAVLGLDEAPAGSLADVLAEPVG